MSRSEGGIPYRTQPRVMPKHMSDGTLGRRPLCATTAWRTITTTKPQDVTCWDCKRKVKEDDQAADDSAGVDRTQQAAAGR